MRSNCESLILCVFKETTHNLSKKLDQVKKIRFVSCSVLFYFVKCHRSFHMKVVLECTLENKQVEVFIGNE